jgi:hypothetical protein
VTNLAVRKQGSDFSPRGTSVKSVYNLHGANARVNVGSHDYSVNTVNVASAKVFANLKTALLTNVQDEALKVQLVELVEHLQLSQGSKSFTAKFQEFMALAANCMTVVAPFVPALTQFLR